jgi:hypothetical protein
MPGLVVSERLSAMCPIDLETVPFWASLSSGFGWLCMTTPQYTFSCLIRSRFPDQFCSPVQQSRFFFPLSTRVYQAHAEGRGCLPFTREAGVAPHEFCGVVAIPLAQYHLPAWICSYESHATSAAQPLSFQTVSGEQVAHTASSGHDHVLSGKMIARDLYWVHRTSAGAARTFGEAAPTPPRTRGRRADSASGGFVRHIPPLPVPAVGPR